MSENYFWRTAFSGNKIWIQAKDPTLLLPLDFDSSHHLLDLGVSVCKVSTSSRDEGLRLLHGLETNLATSLQTPQEA